MPLRPLHQSRAASRPSARVVPPRWSLPWRPAAMVRRKRMSWCGRHSHGTGPQRQLHAARPISLLPALLKCGFVPCVKQRGNCNHAYTEWAEANMTRQLWMRANWWMRDVSTSPLSPLLTNPSPSKLCYSDQRCKSRLNFYIYFGYSLNKGMLKALRSCFLSSWFYLTSFKSLCMTSHNLAVSGIKIWMP